MGDYAPVTQDDEDELNPRSRYLDYAGEGQYPPVTPAPQADEMASVYPPVETAPAATSLRAAIQPAVGSLDDLESRVSRPQQAIQAAPAQPPVAPAPRPQWKDYAPAEPTSGWGKFTRGLGEMFTGGPQRAEQRAEANYKNAASEYEAPIAEQHTEAETAELGKRGEKEGAEAAALRNPKDETPHTVETGQGVFQWNPASKRYDIPVGPPKVDANPDTTDKVVRIVNGVPHEILIDKKTGADIRDLGQTKVPGESADQKRSASEQMQVERESRAAVHKAEQDYNSAQSTVAMQRQLIKDAKAGNKEAVRIVPLEGALQITTSQGVHRINRTEVDQYGQAGSLFDRIMGRIGSGVSGKSIPDDVLEDMDAMTQELGKNAYNRYKREYDYNRQVVEGYGGKDFDKRVPMLPEEKGGAGETQQSGADSLVVKAPNGKSYKFKDQASADAYRKAAGIQ